MRTRSLLLLAFCALCPAVLSVSGCARDTQLQPVASGQMIVAGPGGIEEYDETDVFGFPSGNSGIVVNPTPSETVQINLYDPQSFWDGAFDQNWMNYGW